MSTQLVAFPELPDSWEILLQPNSFTTAWLYAVVLEALGAGSPLPNSTSHLAPLQWLQWKWKHLHCEGIVMSRHQAAWLCQGLAEEQPRPAPNRCAGVQELRHSFIPKEQTPSFGGAARLPSKPWSVLGWASIQLQDGWGHYPAKTPGNPWLLILELPERKEIVHDFDGFCNFCEVIKFSNIFMRWSGKRNMNSLKSYNSEDPNSLQFCHRSAQLKPFCPCPLCLLTQPAVQIWKEFAAGFLFQTLSPHVGYWASSGSGFTDTWLLRISKDPLSSWRIHTPGTIPCLI